LRGSLVPLGLSPVLLPLSAPHLRVLGSFAFEAMSTITLQSLAPTDLDYPPSIGIRSPEARSRCTVVMAWHEGFVYQHQRAQKGEREFVCCTVLYVYERRPRQTRPVENDTHATFPSGSRKKDDRSKQTGKLRIYTRAGDSWICVMLLLTLTEGHLSIAAVLNDRQFTLLFLHAAFADDK
jgi:hypothetical protein